MSSRADSDSPAKGLTLAPGQRLGPYEILGPLGAGGMGEVYRARDTRLGRDVAIKRLRPELASNEDRRKRFEREARAASALNHPHIVSVFDIGEENGVLFIAMELVEGKTLRAVLGEEAPSARRILDLAVQAAGGLARAHADGIVHRDLKPENLMVSRDGYVKILDFGLAKLVEPERVGSGSEVVTAISGTQAGTVLGTIGYMSPEQAAGRAVDFRSDQFSLGTILYEMAAGRKPFERDSGAETLTAIIREEPEPLAPGRAAAARPAALGDRAVPREGPGGALRLHEGPRARARDAAAGASARRAARARRRPPPGTRRATGSRPSSGSRSAAGRSSRRASPPTARP